jgi:hypothetical protein
MPGCMLLFCEVVCGMLIAAAPADPATVPGPASQVFGAVLSGGNAHTGPSAVVRGALQPSANRAESAAESPAGHDAGASRARVRVGLEAGLNQSRVSWAWSRDVGPAGSGPAYRPAWSAGVTLDVPLAPKLTLATGPRYIEYGSLIEYGPFYSTTVYQPDGGAYVSLDYHQTWSYVSLPIQLRMRPFSARGVFLGLGPEVGYLLAVRHDLDVTEGGGPAPLQRVGTAVTRPAAMIFEKVGTLDEIGSYARWNLALSGSVGCEFPFAGHFGLVEARYAHGLVDISRNVALIRETRGFEFLLGVRR